jgi:hypothetical protein
LHTRWYTVTPETKIGDPRKEARREAQLRYRRKNRDAILQVPRKGREEEGKKRKEGGKKGGWNEGREVGGLEGRGKKKDQKKQIPGGRMEGSRRS